MPGPAGLTRAQILGRIAVIAAATCWAVGGILTRFYYGEGGIPTTLVAARTVVAAVGFGIWFLLSSGNRVRTPDILLAGGIGLVQAMFTTALVFGFDNAPVGLVVLLFYTYPLLVAVGAAAFFGERLSRIGLVCVAVGTTGLVLAVGTPSSVTPLGIGLGLAAGIGNAIVVLGNRILLARDLRVLEIATLSYAIPATVAVGLLAIEVIPIPPSSGEAWAYAIAYATTGTVLPYLLFYSAVSVIGASLAALLAMAEPVISVLLTYLILGERLGPWQLLGGALIVAAVLGLALRAAPVARAPQAHL